MEGRWWLHTLSVVVCRIAVLGCQEVLLRLQKRPSCAARQKRRRLLTFSGTWGVMLSSFTMKSSLGMMPSLLKGRITPFPRIRLLIATSLLSVRGMLSKMLWVPEFLWKTSRELYVLRPVFLESQLPWRSKNWPTKKLGDTTPWYGTISRI